MHCKLCVPDKAKLRLGRVDKSFIPAFVDCSSQCQSQFRTWGETFWVLTWKQTWSIQIKNWQRWGTKQYSLKFLRTRKKRQRRLKILKKSRTGRFIDICVSVSTDEYTIAMPAGLFIECTLGQNDEAVLDQECALWSLSHKEAPSRGIFRIMPVICRQEK